MVGRDARIRVSSVTTAFSRGTFRSARTSTRRPSTSASLTLALVNERVLDASALTGTRRRALSTDRRRLQHLLRQLNAAVGVTPLVVVPGEDLHELAVEDDGLLGVEYGRVGIGDDVGRDDRVLGVLENPLERALSRLVHRRVDLLDAGLATDVAGQIDERSGDHGGADGDAVELALEVG